MSPPDQGGTQGAGDNKPIRIPLVTDLGNRSESYKIDARLINAYAEKVGQNDAYIYKRPGLTQFSVNPGGAAPGWGIYNWNGDIYSIFGTGFYKNNVLLGTVASGLPYTFNQILGAFPSLFFHNGVNFYQYNTTTGFTPLAPGFTCQPGSAYLDGTMYLLDSAAVIHGSDLNLLSVWDLTNQILAQIESDVAVVIAKQLVYVIAFKAYSTEMFYDAGNATGSPLGSVPGQKLNYGIRHFGTLAELSGVLLWVDAIKNGGMSVRVMDQLTAQPCSTPQIERLLQYADHNGWFTTLPVYSWTAKIDGHMFYALTIQGLNVTLVHDLTQKLWYEWTDTNGNYMPIVSSTFYGGSTLLQHQSNGLIYTLSTQVGTDLGAMFTTEIYTPEFDGGTYRRKVIDKMRFIGDIQPGNVFQVRVSDDDFNSWSNFREVDMGQLEPTLANCGTFKRRVWNLKMRTTSAGRIIKALEPEIEVGDL